MPATNAAAVALAAALLLAGCLGGVGGPDSTPTPADRTTTDGTTTDATTTRDARQLAHEVRVENHLNVARSVTVTITQAGDVVHEGRYAVEPGTDVIVYGWAAETVDGNRTFVVRVRPDGGETRQVTFTVDDCHGNVVGFFADGGFDLTYSVC